MCCLILGTSVSFFPNLFFQSIQSESGVRSTGIDFDTAFIETLLFLAHSGCAFRTQVVAIQLLTVVMHVVVGCWSGCHWLPECSLHQYEKNCRNINSFRSLDLAFWGTLIITNPVLHVTYLHKGLDFMILITKHGSTWRYGTRSSQAVYFCCSWSFKFIAYSEGRTAFACSSAPQGASTVHLESVWSFREKTEGRVSLARSVSPD